LADAPGLKLCQISYPYAGQLIWQRTGRSPCFADCRLDARGQPPAQAKQCRAADHLRDRQFNQTIQGQKKRKNGDADRRKSKKPQHQFSS